MVDQEQVMELLTTALSEGLPIGFVIALIEVAVAMFFCAVTGRNRHSRGDY